VVGRQDLSDLALIKPGRSRAVTSAEPDPNSNSDRIRYVTPGETKVLADIKGPAVIRHIWLTFTRPGQLARGRGSAGPMRSSFACTGRRQRAGGRSALGDFFGAGFGLRREVRSVPVQVESGDGYNCYWPMPFHKRGRITVTNEGAKNVRSFYYHIDYTMVRISPTKPPTSAPSTATSSRRRRDMIT